MASADSITKELSDELAAIRNDLKSLRDDFAAAARTAGDAVVKGKRTAATALRDKVEDLRANGSEIASSVEREIEQRPLTAVAIAFGVGFVVGKLLDRR